MTVSDRPEWWPRFETKFVKRADGCWKWTAAQQGRGYGFFYLHGKNRQAHRLAYEVLVGPIPEGLHIDHLCRRPWCVNPDHLEPVTVSQNKRRGVQRYGELGCFSRYSEAEVQRARDLRADGLTIARIAAITGISNGQVHNIVTGGQRAQGTRMTVGEF